MLPKIPPVWSLQQQQPSSVILLQPLNASQTPQGVRLLLGLGGICPGPWWHVLQKGPLHHPVPKQGHLLPREDLTDEKCQNMAEYCL